MPQGGRQPADCKGDFPCQEGHDAKELHGILRLGQLVSKVTSSLNVCCEVASCPALRLFRTYTVTHAQLLKYWSS
eukprot:2746179-Pleurochrysis_carterae.AAC.1